MPTTGLTSQENRDPCIARQGKGAFAHRQLLKLPCLQMKISVAGWRRGNLAFPWGICPIQISPTSPRQPAMFCLSVWERINTSTCTRPGFLAHFRLESTISFSRERGKILHTAEIATVCLFWALSLLSSYRSIGGGGELNNPLPQSKL